MIEGGILKPSGVIQLRGGTAEVLKAENPLPSRRELILEIDTGRIKCGDGSHSWNELPYVSGSERCYSLVLSSEDIAAKGITLPSDYDGTGSVRVTVNGLEASLDEDYALNGYSLEWAGLWLDGILQASDKITITYTRR